MQILRNKVSPKKKALSQDLGHPSRARVQGSQVLASQVVKVKAAPNLPGLWRFRLSAQFLLGTPLPGSPSGLAERRGPRTGVPCDWLPFRPALPGTAIWADVGPVLYQPINVPIACGACLCLESLRRDAAGAWLLQSEKKFLGAGAEPGV